MKSSSKYQPLLAHLEAQRGSHVSISFAEIERVLGAELPPSARLRRAWWSNNPTGNARTKAWLEAGFHSEQIDLKGRKLVFRRVSSRPQAQATAVNMSPEVAASRKLSLFGWMRGTVVSTDDLTKPAGARQSRIVRERPRWRKPVRS
jgi:hypothetical protein